LRTVPELAAEVGANFGGTTKLVEHDVIVPVLRALATACVQAIQPDETLHPIAGPAATIAYGVGGAVSNMRVRAAIAAASAACDCAADIDVVGAASYGAAAVYAASRLSSDCSHAAGHDVEMLNNLMSPAAFAIQKLWPNDVPDLAQNAWLQLKNGLLAANETWDVWIDWYEARISGGVQHRTWERELVTLPEELWSQPPIILNTPIQQ
jgi:hypothetical protein